MEDKGKKIHQNITRLAYERGLGVNDLCKQAKVSSGLISDLKHGRRDNIGDITLDKLCRVLQCDKEDILDMRKNTEPMPERPHIDRIAYFNDKVEEALRERPELRRLIRAAMNANAVQVKATAVLLENITNANMDGGIISGDE